jgi:hypothetical protein
VVKAQQDSSGVYMSSNDFQNRKLSYAINCKRQKHKIKLKTFFDKPYIVVVHNDSSYNLPKSEVYGYRDCDGITYRFVDSQVYKIMNLFNPIVLYQYFVFIPKDPVVDYYFSKGNSGEVELLTKANLKLAFPENHKFHDLLDLTFTNDVDLTSYDKKSKAFKLMVIYSMSLK